MNEKRRALIRKIAKYLLPEEEYQNILSIKFNDSGFGFDKFGFEIESALLAFIFSRLLYKKYFRVKSRGIENIPKSGRAIIIGNHSGVVPLDATMLSIDIATNLKPPRLLRSAVDFFAYELPYIGLWLTRMGQVVGTKSNFSYLLAEENMIGIFPEGTRGIGKPFKERYNLKEFSVGHVELSLKFKAPIIPVSIVGAEEQAPMLYNIKNVAKIFKIPFFPITPTFPWLGPLGVIPLPTRYYIRYGKPLKYYERENIKINPASLKQLADETRENVQKLVNLSLIERDGVFK